MEEEALWGEITSTISALDICGEFCWLVVDVGGAAFGEIVLGAIRKQDEQAMTIKAVSKSKQCVCMVSVSLSTSRFLPDVPALNSLYDRL